MKKNCLLLVFLLCVNLMACGDVEETLNIVDTASTVETLSSEKEIVVESPKEETVQEQKIVYFESDGVVDGFFIDYNSIAEIAIPVEEIEKGNIRSKALVYIDDLSLEVINADTFLAISMSTEPENECDKLYIVFRDVIKAKRTDIKEEEIKNVWESIRETGYLVDGFDFDGISITYVPSKELSWGISKGRIELEIPLE